MHTPDGFLTDWICIITLVIALGFIAFSIINSRKWMTKDKAFLMAGLASAIFAFQMLNFNISNATSGHLIGAALVAILLGPQAAIIVMTAVLLVQTLIFADGGLLALGANILLMGIVAGYTAHYVYQPIKTKLPIIGTILASISSVLAASFFASILFAISSLSTLKELTSSMVMTHLFIGIGEAIITTSIILYIKNTKSDLLLKNNVKDLTKYVAISTLGALFVMSFALPFASSNPDGMEKVALNLGFYDKATQIFSLSPMPDYTFLGNESYLFVLFSGILGMFMTFSAGYLITRPLVLSS